MFCSVLAVVSSLLTRMISKALKISAFTMLMNLSFSVTGDNNYWCPDPYTAIVRVVLVLVLSTATFYGRAVQRIFNVGQKQENVYNHSTSMYATRTRAKEIKIVSRHDPGSTQLHPCYCAHVVPTYIQSCRRSMLLSSSDRSPA